jgi:endothelin-converting enzyme/putative endopeptidase
MSQRKAALGLRGRVVQLKTAPESDLKEMAPILRLAALVLPGVAVGDPNADFAHMVEECMDTSASPCDDMYQYACGGWLKTHPIPETDVKTSRFYQGGELQATNDAVLTEILQQDPPTIGPYYQSCLNATAVIDTQIEQLISAIATVSDPHSLGKVVAELHLANVPALFARPRPANDLTAPAQLLLQLYEGGLGLPSATYYADSTTPLMKSYGTHVGNMFALLAAAAGSSSGEAAAAAAAEAAADALAVETALALAVVPFPSADFLKANASYHPSDTAAVGTRFASSGWDDYFGALGIQSGSRVNVVEGKYFSGLDNLLKTAFGGGDAARSHEPAAGAAATSEPADGVTDGVRALRNYLTWQLLHHLSPVLPTAFGDETFAFFGTVLQGQKARPPRAKRCLDEVSGGGLGELLGKAFAGARFAGDSKQEAVDMLTAIRAAFYADVGGLGWLDAPTAAFAAKKAGQLVFKMGYPDTWMDYTGLHGAISGAPGAHGANWLAVQRWYYAGLLTRGRGADGSGSGGAVDPNRWDEIAIEDDGAVWPQTVTAFNAESPNALLVPAGIIQMPLFNASFPPALRYGGVGAVVGHEFTHSYDNVGRHFGLRGELYDWWTDKTADAFAQRAQCMIDQYSSYPVLPGLNLNGTFVLQENIADNGGMRLAFTAYRTEAGGDAGGAAPSLLANHSNDQLFFLQFAQNWCFKMTDDYARFWVKNNQVGGGAGQAGQDKGKSRAG